MTRLQRRKYQAYMRSVGTPLRIHPTEMAQLRDRVNTLLNAGMSSVMIAQQVGACPTNIMRIAHGVTARAHRSTYNKLMACHPEPAPRTRAQGSKVPTTVPFRMLRALRADGYTLETIATFVSSTEQGCTVQNLSQILRDNRPLMYASTARRITDAYNKYGGTDPGALQTPLSTKRARTWAAKSGCAPSHCWDEDTIRDPQAIPEWTGHCGTNHGYQLHYKYPDIPACPPCLQAHSDATLDWKYEAREARHQQIRALIAAGKTTRQIADKVGCSQRTIARARNNGRLKPEG